MRRRRPQRPGPGVPTKSRWWGADFVGWGQRGSSGRGGPPPLALMFESLSDRLGAVLKRLSGRGVLIVLLGGNDRGLRYSDRPPTVVLLAGLQGSGKTTTAVKLALHARREGHRPMVVALDLRRPAAVEQLQTLAR